MVQVSFAFPVHTMVSQVKNIIVLGVGGEEIRGVVFSRGFRRPERP